MHAVLVPSFAAWLAVLGCGGAPATPAPTPPPVIAVPRNEAPPAPTPRARPPEPPVDPLRPGSRRRLIEIAADPAPGTSPLPLPLPLRGLELYSERKSDLWSPCVRAFVQTQPAAARELLGEALSLFSTTCTSTPTGRVEFEVPRARRTAGAQSQLALVGALEATTCEVSLRAGYRGEPIRAERITLIADGVWWTSPRIDFDGDGGGEVATLPFTRALARVVKRALDARDTVLRFESARGYEDVVVTDELKQELRTMIDALDAINRP